MNCGPERNDDVTGGRKTLLIRQTDLFVLDMDGTIYLGEQLFPFTNDFLRAVKDAGKQYLFFTNNSSRTVQDYVEKLARLGIRAGTDEIMTSGDVLLRYLLTKRTGESVYLLAVPSVVRQYEEEGIRLFDPAKDPDGRPDIAAVLFDTTLTYEKLDRACAYIREGASFLASHPDINCPKERGFAIDCGAICEAIRCSTGVSPEVVGKPFPGTVEMIEERTGIPRDRISFVGDRLYTDVAVGVNNGAHGILVLSGEAKIRDLAGSKVQPDAVFADLSEIIPCL